MQHPEYGNLKYIRYYAQTLVYRKYSNNISFDKSIRISEVQHPGHGGSSICPDLGGNLAGPNQIEEIRTPISSIFGALSIIRYDKINSTPTRCFTNFLNSKLQILRLKW